MGFAAVKAAVHVIVRSARHLQTIHLTVTYHEHKAFADGGSVFYMCSTGCDGCV